MPALIEPPPVGQRSASASSTKALFAALREEFGVPFFFYRGADGQPIQGDNAMGPDASSEFRRPDSIRRLTAGGQSRVNVLDDLRYELAIPVTDSDKTPLIAIGVLDTLALGQSERLQEQTRLEKWANSVALRWRVADSGGERPSSANANGGQPSNAWNSLLTLDKLFRRLRVHKEPTKYRQRIVDSAAELLNVQTLAWVSKNGGDPVIGGQPCLSTWDCQQLAQQLARNQGWDETGVFVCNNVAEQSWSARCPNVANLCAITLLDQRLNGWAIAINKLPPEADRAKSGQSYSLTAAEAGLAAAPILVAPFRRQDAAVMTPFLSLLGLYQSASQRYHTLKELMVGLARALTASIDAKDQYTYGHSERVARIAVELGGELGLDEDELNDIYLAGLLHDIGKIGVPDAVLGKPGALTPEETAQVRQHVTIGYKILSGLKSIGHLLPGVLYHHERFDGGGYPDGLKGDAIPMLARILAVADAYDAMSSSRPYREGMPLAKVEEVLTQGAGTQWDKNVVFAFLRSRQRIHAIRQRGIGESLRFALDGVMRDHDHFDLDSSAVPLNME